MKPHHPIFTPCCPAFCGHSEDRLPPGMSGVAKQVQVQAHVKKVRALDLKMPVPLVRGQLDAKHFSFANPNSSSRELGQKMFETIKEVQYCAAK